MNKPNRIDTVRAARLLLPALAFAWSLAAGAHAASPPLVTFAKDSSWDGGFGGSVTITNRDAAPIASWQLQYDGGPTITSIWNGTLSTAGSRATIVNAGWNATIAPGASVTVGFNGSGTFTQNATNASVNGVAAEIAWSGFGSGGGSGGSGGSGGGTTSSPGVPHGPFDCLTDLNGDGTTDGSDLGVLLGAAIRNWRKG